MVIALDSNVFIAALSPNEHHSLNAQQLMRSVDSGKHKALASSLVYSEVLSVRNASQSLDLEDFFVHIDNLTTIPADEMRLEYGPKLKLPDAIQLATALGSNADLFITNDEKLAQVAQKLIPTKQLSEWA